MNHQHMPVNKERLIHWAILWIDEKINKQLNAIIHHQTFQQLEARWRGLFYLAGYVQSKKSPIIKLKILDLSYKEASCDLMHAMDIEYSQLFKWIYTDELDRPGGEPYGLLLGDYYLSCESEKEKLLDGVSFLRMMGQIASIAYSPIVVGVHPRFFGLKNWGLLARPMDILSMLKNHSYARWHALTKELPSCFLGMVLPRILMRNSYKIQEKARFKEIIAQHDDYLWGNANYAFAAAVMSSFLESAWFESIGEIKSKGEDYAWEMPCAVDVSITQTAHDMRAPGEVVLSHQHCLSLKKIGLMGFKALHYEAVGAFAMWRPIYSSLSLQGEKMPPFGKEIFLSFSYIFCLCRFAHYIKALLRDKIGRFSTPESCQHYLHEWLLSYCDANQDSKNTLKPLKDASVFVHYVPGRKDVYYCKIELMPCEEVSLPDVNLSIVGEIKICG